MMMISVYTKRIPLLFSIITLFLLQACSDDTIEVDEDLVQEYRYFDLYMGSTFKDTIDEPTANGLYYIEVSEGTGETPGENDWLMMNHVAYTIPNESVVESYMENVVLTSGLPTNVAMFGPYKFQNGSSAAGLSEGLSMMREGGEAIMCFTSELGFGPAGTKLMRSVAGYTSMKYEVVLLEVIGEDIIGYEADRIVAYTDTIPGADTIYDSAIGATMYYVIDEANEDGSAIGDDSIVEIAYRGYLLDGREFDESAEGEPYKFTVGDYQAETSPIAGWHMGVKKFRMGEKGRLIIPYPLAYGADGRVQDNVVAIPPYETLVFDIEIVSVGGIIDPKE